MPLTSAQIVSLACSEARVPGMIVQGGQKLNSILSDLCQTYDFTIARQSVAFTFNASQINSQGQAYQNLPDNYLRGIRNGSYYTISGVPYPMIPCDQVEEYNMLVEQAGLANFPVFYATDMSRTGVSNAASGSGGALVPVMLFWQVPSGAYPANVYYFSQMPDIATPETSATVPWFPNQTYLMRRLAGEMMSFSDDERRTSYLSSDEDRFPEGAGVMLRHYLQMQGDKSTRTATVQLDRRRFGTSFDRLRSTKTIGW